MLYVCTHFFSLFQYLLWYVQKVHMSWCNAFSVMIKQEVLSLLLIFPNSFYLIIADKDCISVFFKCSPCCFGKSAVLVVFSWNLSKSTRQCWWTHSSPSVHTVLRQSTQFSVSPHSSPSVHTVLCQSTQFSISPHSSPSVHTVLHQSTQFSVSPHSSPSVHTVLCQSTQFSISPLALFLLQGFQCGRRGSSRWRWEGNRRRRSGQPAVFAAVVAAVCGNRAATDTALAAHSAAGGFHWAVEIRVRILENPGCCGGWWSVEQRVGVSQGTGELGLTACVDVCWWHQIAQQWKLVILRLTIQQTDRNHWNSAKLVLYFGMKIKDLCKGFKVTWRTYGEGEREGAHACMFVCILFCLHSKYCSSSGGEWLIFFHFGKIEIKVQLHLEARWTNKR